MSSDHGTREIAKVTRRQLTGMFGAEVRPGKKSRIPGLRRDGLIGASRQAEDTKNRRNDPRCEQLSRGRHGDQRHGPRRSRNSRGVDDQKRRRAARNRPYRSCRNGSNPEGQRTLAGRTGCRPPGGPPPAFPARPRGHPRPSYHRNQLSRGPVRLPALPARNRQQAGHRRRDPAAGVAPPPTSPAPWEFRPEPARSRHAQ